MSDRSEDTRRRWTIELTLKELLLIERALARLPVEEPEVSSRVLPIVVVDEAAQMISIANERFAFKPTSFRLLAHLIGQPGRWVRTDEIREQVLATRFQEDASNVRWHVLQARRTLGSRAYLIHSDNRLGFMFGVAPCERRHCASVTRAAESTRPVWQNRSSSG